MFNLDFGEAQAWFYLGVGFLKYFCEVQPSCQPRGAWSLSLKCHSVIIRKVPVSSKVWSPTLWFLQE